MSTVSRPINVHVLSEHVFCPRAAVLAWESGEDTGDEEPSLGPRLDDFLDYDERRFAEELRVAWGSLRRWLAFFPFAGVLTAIVWCTISPLWGVVSSVLLFVLAALSWDTTVRIVQLIRERMRFEAAAPAAIDLGAREVRKVNWWSLRKAGFDCLKPNDAIGDLTRRLTGRPWRILTKDTAVRIPVARKHRGKAEYRPQHVIRLAAYCHLIETNELARVPFGVLMFAGTYDCLILPNTVAARLEFEHALEETREFLQELEKADRPPAAPSDNRCGGCPFGMPRVYVAGETDTMLGGRCLPANRVRAGDGRLYHSPCGDRFEWVPPHERSVALGIA